METILIVDDEKNYLSLLSAILEEENYQTITTSNGMSALEILEQTHVDLIITDVKMPAMNGLELLEKTRTRWPDIPVIMMTAHGSVEKAVEAMHKGAFTFIQKPFENDSLVLFVSKALNLSMVVQENKRLRNEVKSHYRFGNIIGKSKLMQEIHDVISKVAPTPATVLIEGESGTGKELVAKSIHFNSPRRNNPFITVNCSTLSEPLLESELFGHEKGAFTGAISMKKGRFELAHKGTIFLDEIGELPLNLQVKLLRVIQEKYIERVGGTAQIDVDFRLIAATNKKLSEEVQNGRFREDLYYRLNVVHLNPPPLRKRPEDIHLLVNHFLDKYSHLRDLKTPVKGLESKCERVIYDFNWPGNVRQLENTIERAMILCTKEFISLGDLPPEITSFASNPIQMGNIDSNSGLYKTISSFEKQMIINALIQTNGIQTHAAKILKIGKSGLNQKLKKHGIIAKEYNKTN